MANEIIIKLANAALPWRTKNAYKILLENFVLFVYIYIVITYIYIYI